MKLVCIAFFLLLLISVYAEENEACGDTCTWTLDDEGTLTISGSGEMNDYNDDSNCPPWHSSRGSIKNVVIEEGITTIGSSVFSGLAFLTSITIPNAITIESDAFSGCHISSLTIVGTGEIKIESREISTGLANAVIGEGITSIESSALSDLSNLQFVSIGNDITSIPESLFSGLSNLQSVSVGDGVTEIPNGLFSGLTNLQKVELGANVETIGNNAFKECKKLNEITLPSTVNSIGEDAFQSCTELKKIELGANVKTIGNNAFKECKILNELILPSTVSSIGEGTFQSCTELRTLKIGEHFLIGEQSKTRNNEREGGTEIKLSEIPGNAFSGCTSIKSVNIPTSVATIGTNAFSGCSALSQFSVESTTTQIDDTALTGCTGLISGKYGTLEWARNKESNSLTFSNGGTLHPLSWLAQAFEAKSIIIGAGVTILETNALKGFTSVEDITFTDSVKTLKSGALPNL